ncbi:MAG: DinB family protein [Anaerolineae bacterium]|nr:DinB family protein [Anaerolineae bacterium]
MIAHVDQFTNYFDSIRRRTLNYVRAVPPDKIDWQPKTGELTCGDIVRHLAAAELMFVGAAVEGKWRYTGHERDDEHGSLVNVLNTLETSHTAAMKILTTLSDADLIQPRPSLADGPPIKAWRLLMAMVEHEIHHRSQLAVYLSLLGVEPPQIYGLGVEDVIALATG